AGLVGGTRLDCAGETLLTVGPEIESIHLHYVGDKLEVAVRGRGIVSVLAGAASKVYLKGVNHKAKLEKSRLVFSNGAAGNLKLSEVKFANDPKSLYQAIGLPPDRALNLSNGACKNSIVVAWTSSEPASALVEYRLSPTDPWRRSINPELTTQH